jgi:nitronate monooxygenase
MYRGAVSRARHEVTMLANFVEVWLAKQGHDGPVGINLLTKVQMPNIASLYGAMLAGVDYVLMGAGIPKEIPGVLDRLAAHEPASMKLDVEGAGPAEYLTLEPATFWDGATPVELKRPKFLPIVSAASLAQMLARKSNGRVDGFIVEGPTAGGHNAPPRGTTTYNERNEPVYGERDPSTWSRCGRSGCRSGWRAARARRMRCRRRGCRALRASRWVRSSPTRRSPAWPTT